MLAVFWRDAIVDPDCLYHAGHARVYWENGPFFRDFPWASASVISRERSDLWWGLHILVSPIGMIPDPVLAMRVGIAELVALHLLILGLAYRRLDLSPWWALISLTASAGALSRLITLRPQTLSAALLPLLFAELWRRSTWTACAVGAALGLFHPTLGYLILPITVATAVTAGRKKSKLPEVAALASALLFAFVRPGPDGGAHLLKVQTIDLFAVRKLGVILNFGNELTKADRGYFLYGALVPTILLGLALLFVRKPTFKSPAPVVYGLCAIFLGIFFFVTKRGVDTYVPFAVLAFALVAGSWKQFPKITPFLALIACGFAVNTYTRDKLKVTPITRRFEGAAKWLAANSRPDEVVYHTVWSHFADLFFWNRQNRYLGGMDPMFQWAVSPENYWLTTPIHPKRYAGMIGPVDPAVSQKQERRIFEIVPKVFGARFIMAGKGERQFVDALKGDTAHYALRYQGGDGYVFEIIKRTP